MLSVDISNGWNPNFIKGGRDGLKHPEKRLRVPEWIRFEGSNFVKETLGNIHFTG